MRKRLVLSKETLAELATDELQSVVAAGTHTYCETGITYCQICPIIDRPAIGTIDSPCQTR